MARWDSPAPGAPDDSSAVRERRPERRAVLVGRSFAAPAILAVTTVAAVAGAVLALLPAVVRRRPMGRPGLRRAEDGAASPTASQPLAP